MKISENEGQIRIYVFEARDWYSRRISPLDFGEQEPTYFDDWSKVCPIYNEYGVNGECWRLTGLKGFVDRDRALEAYRKLVKYTDVEWRVIEKNIVVYNNVVCTS